MAARGRSGSDSALIAALAGGATHEAAAQQAGVGERTVRRRLEDPDFARRVDEARAALLEQAMAQLSRAATGAATTLVMLLEAARKRPPQSPWSRLGWYLRMRTLTEVAR